MTIEQIIKEIDRRIVVQDYLALVDYGEQLDTDMPLDWFEVYDMGAKARTVLYRTFPELEDSGITGEQFMALTDTVARELYENH